MGDTTGKSGPMHQILIAVIIALLAGGSAPWWWDKVFGSKVNVNAPKPDQPSGRDDNPPGPSSPGPSVKDKPAADFPQGSRRIYSATFNQWPVQDSQYGSVALGAGNTYLLKPAGNTWIGSGRMMEIPRLESDFVYEVRFQVRERTSDASLNVQMSGAEEDAEALDAYLELWGDRSPTYSIYRSKIKRVGLPVPHLITEERIAERVQLPAAIGGNDWSRGGTFVLKREGGRMALFVNEEFVRDFAVSLFPFNQIAIGAAFPCAIEITSIEARIRP